MKKINIREALLKIDKDSFCQYDLTSLYEACNLDDEDKCQLVKYIDAYEHPSVIGGFLETKCQGVNESFDDDDVSDIKGAEKIIAEINDLEIPAIIDVDDIEETTLNEEIVDEVENEEKETLDEAFVIRDANEVRKYVWKKILPFDSCTDDDSYYWDFDQDVRDGLAAKLVTDELDIPDNAHYKFSLPEADLNFFFVDNPEYCYFVIDKNYEAPANEDEDSVNEGIFGIKTKKEKEKEAKAKAEKERQKQRDKELKDREEQARQQATADSWARNDRARRDAQAEYNRSRSTTQGSKVSNTGRAGIYYSGGDYYSESINEDASSTKLVETELENYVIEALGIEHYTQGFMDTVVNFISPYKEQLLNFEYVILRTDDFEANDDLSDDLIIDKDNSCDVVIYKNVYDVKFDYITKHTVQAHEESNSEESLWVVDDETLEDAPQYMESVDKDLIHCTECGKKLNDEGYCETEGCPNGTLKEGLQPADEWYLKINPEDTEGAEELKGLFIDDVIKDKGNLDKYGFSDRLKGILDKEFERYSPMIDEDLEKDLERRYTISDAHTSNSVLSNIEELAASESVKEINPVIKYDTQMFEMISADGRVFYLIPVTMSQFDVYDADENLVTKSEFAKYIVDEVLSDKSNLEFVYEIVGGDCAGKYSREELEALPCFSGKYTDDQSEIRANGGFTSREELDNQPILSGYVGPMMNGWENHKMRIRYETQEVYDSLSEDTHDYVPDEDDMGTWFDEIQPELEEGLWDDVKKVAKTVGNVAKDRWNDSYTKAIATGIKKNFDNSRLGQDLKKIGDSVKETDTYQNIKGKVDSAKQFIKDNKADDTRKASDMAINVRGKNYRVSDLKYKLGGKPISADEVAKMNSFKRAKVQTIVPRGTEPIKESIEKCMINESFSQEQLDKAFEIADRYCTSSPISGDWSTEAQHEMNAIADELGISEDAAKELMIKHLGFDDSMFIEESFDYIDDEGYTEEEIIAQLEKELPNLGNDGVVRYGYASEAKVAEQFLKKHYALAELDSVGSWFQIEYADLFKKEEVIQMTADEMKDKFGTDNADIVNCGRPEEDGTIELKEDTSTHLYLFPELTDEDLQVAKTYGLNFLGKNHGGSGDENNWVIAGDLISLERFADKYLGYELHPDYLYAEEDFAGDIVEA